MDLELEPSYETLSSLCSSEGNAPDPKSLSLRSTAETTPRCVLRSRFRMSRARIVQRNQEENMSNSVPRQHPYARAYTPQRSLCPFATSVGT
jgi:hypothetical protein